LGRRARRRKGRNLARRRRRGRDDPRERARSAGAIRAGARPRPAPRPSLHARHAGRTLRLSYRAQGAHRRKNRLFAGLPCRFLMKTCLIVDDSEVVRRTLRRMIEDMGFRCAEAAHGAEAYDICRAQMPGVVTLDWNMPVMDGLEFLKKLRRMPGGDKPGVIFCTTES